MLTIKKPQMNRFDLSLYNKINSQPISYHMVKVRCGEESSEVSVRCMGIIVNRVSYQFEGIIFIIL